jgi:cytochrome P450
MSKADVGSADPTAGDAPTTADASGFSPSMLTLPEQNFPDMREIAFVTRFDEALEVMRSPRFRQGKGTRSIQVALDADRSRVADSARFEDAAEHPEMESWDVLLRRGDLHHAEGDAHIRLRRTLGPLFGRDAHTWFRDEVIQPNVKRNLGRILSSPDAEGTPRVDLVQLAKRIYIQAAAALVGFDGTQDDAGADELIALHAKIEGNADLTRILPNGPKLREHAQLVLAGRDELRDRFYRPSLARRVSLVDRRNGGEDVKLPHDLLSLIAQDAEGLRMDEQAGMSNAMSFLNGATGTNTQVLTNLFGALTAWFEIHPEDYAHRMDPSFLEGALEETIRVYGPGGTAFSRIALEDVTLGTGRTINAGQYVAVVKRFVNRDRSVYGPDADEFNPRRVAPRGIYPFGIGFGSGSHMCIGLPLVLGQGGISGMQVPILQTLYEAGAKPDPGRPASKRAEMLAWQDDYATYPLIFDQRG